MLQFQNIEYLAGLLVLAPLLVLFLYVLRWKHNTRKRLGDKRLIDQLTVSYSPKRFNLKNILVLLALAFGILAMANLHKPLTGQGSKANGIDIMIALDVSKSMLSEDEKPTRLDKAKQLINQLTDRVANNRVGMVVFAGQAYLQMPLTADATATKMFVSDASPELVSVQGTNLSSALQLADASLDTREKKYKAVVLITDGEDHEDKAVETAKQLADHGTILYTVGVGSPEGSPITEPGTNEYKRDENGQTVISKLNEPLLKDLAHTANGTYHRLTSVSSVSGELENELNNMEKKTISSAGGYIEYKSFYPYFLAAAILLLMAEVFISERKPALT